MSRRRGRPKDSPQLKSRILAAAAEEFSRFGYAGARIERIAAAAECNRALVYFYFEGKAGLFEAVLNEGADNRSQQMAGQPKTLAEGLVYWFRQNMADPQRIRLVMQEALAEESTTSPARRATYLEGQLAVVRAFQERGLLRADIDARCLLTMILALTSFPAAFPGVARTALGAADDASLVSDWSACLQIVADVLSTPQPGLAAPTGGPG